MKLISRFLLFTICFVLVISPCSIAVNADETSEIVNIKADDLELYKALEIIDSDFAFSNQNYVTKGEIAYIAACLISLKNINATKQIFLDVSMDDKYAGAIEALADSSIISGKGDGTFGIEQYATLNETAKIFVSILGYEIRAQYSGGYPNGYLNTASDIKLLKGISKYNDLLSQDDFITILNNIIEIDIPLFSSISGNNIEYNVERGRTLLTEYHDIYMDSGIVTGNAFTSFDGVSMSEEYVKIDTFGVVAVGDTNASEYLGHYVDYYIKDYEEDTCRLLYIEDSRKNEMFVIEADSLCNEKTSLSAIYYYDEDDDLEDCRLSADVKIVYNGVLERSITLDMLKPKNGRITLIDSDSDGKSDVAIVEDVIIGVVDGVDVKDGKLYLKHTDKVYTLDVDSENVKVRNLKEEIDLKYINKDDVVSIAESKDKSVISIVASNTKITGSIDSISDDEIVINDEKYKVSSYYYELLSRTDIYVPQIKVSLNATFYLDEFGNIAYISQGKSDGFIYAYLLNAYVDDSLDETIGFKVFTQDGKLLNLEAAEKIKVCDNRLNNPDEIKNYVFEQGQVKRQLVRIRINDEGKVRELYTATKTDETIGYDIEKFSHDYGVKSIRHRFGALGTKYRVNGSTIVFTVPEELTDYENYSVIEAASLLEDFTYDKASIYDADENKIANVVVLYDMQGGGGLDVALYQTKISIVDSVGGALDKYGDLTDMLYHYTDGVREKNIVKNPEGENIYSRYWSYDDIKVSDLKSGDIVQLRLNADGEIETFHVLYRGESTYYESSSSGAPTVDWYTGALHTAFGVVKDKVSKRITVNAHGDGSDYNWDREFLVDGIPVYIWDDEARMNCEHGTIHDINIGDKVFVKTINNAVREVVVFK